jgi:AAA family ATPase
MRFRASQKDGAALPTDSKYMQKEEREREYLSRTIYKPIPPYTLKDFAGKPLISLSEIFSTTPVLDYFLKLQGHSTILLHGSPGTGKTFFVECFAGEIADRNPKYKYISCSSADIMDSSLGVSETRVRMLFKEIEKSRPCVCLLDEIEALIPCRNKEKQEYSVRITDEFLLGLNQLINENKKPENMKNDRQVIFFGATNHTNMVDEAALSRFYQITVPLPDMEQRKSVLHSCLENMVSLDDDLTFEEMADLTEGFSHRDLNHLKNDIAEAIKEKILNRYSSQEEMIQALKHGRERLARADFEKALKTATPPELTKKLQAV